MRSNGKTVSQNEAMELMPMDTDVIDELLSEFMKKMDDFKKKQDAKRNMQNQRRK